MALRNNLWVDLSWGAAPNPGIYRTKHVNGIIDLRQIAFIISTRLRKSDFLFIGLWGDAGITLEETAEISGVGKADFMGDFFNRSAIF